MENGKGEEEKGRRGERGNGRTGEGKIGDSGILAGQTDGVTRNSQLSISAP